VTTTLAKAKAARSVAEKMVTLGKKGSLHDRRLAAARLHQEDACRVLFKEIAPFFKDRNGGYTRIVRLNQRIGDAAQLAILEWIDMPVEETAEPAKTEAPKVEKTEPAKTEDSQSIEEKAEQNKAEAAGANEPQPEEQQDEEKKPEANSPNKPASA